METIRKKLNIKNILVIVCAALFVMFLAYLKTREYLLPKVVVQIGDQKVVVEVADSPLARSRGLSGHAPLEENQGMLFIFPKPDRHQFWMKDMKFPIDIVWLNDGRVVDVAPDVPVSVTKDLPVYSPRLPASSVLELRAGFMVRHGIKIGDVVELLTK
ncbi:MAG: DUF192 domain-containing protein [Candidatus Magasanikbacteria bacterium]|nr:DUF192 domain-containing protein [Candidatus Magasanikbacteria bacterium]